MGEVYKARDTKLDRDVAIKILPEAFAADAERVKSIWRWILSSIARSPSKSCDRTRWPKKTSRDDYSEKLKPPPSWIIPTSVPSTTSTKQTRSHSS